MPQSKNYYSNRNTRFQSKQTENNWLLPFVLIGSGLFVWLTSQSLPDIVASHFIASGVANGFMPKIIYIRLMIALVVILPILIAYLPCLTMNSPDARINLPNRDYWLSPERRQNTINLLCRSMKSAALILAIFLSYVHWLVVQANAINPPMMSKHSIIIAIVILIISMLYWSWLLIKPFRNIPR